MSAHTTHPLADAYLRDLELLLHGVDTGDREEVLAGVREHLEERLGSEPADDEVRAALVELGPPQAIADEAYAGRPAPTPIRPRGGPWQAVVATAVNGVGGLFAGLLALKGAHPVELVFLGAFFTLPWLLALTLSAVSPVWHRREKAVSAMFFPVLVVVLAVVTAILQRGAGSWSAATATGVVVVVLGAAATLTTLLRRALR